MDGPWKILGNNQVDISILTSQGGALFADSIPHVFMTFGISLKPFTIQLGLNEYMVNNVYKTIYFWVSSRQSTLV